MEKFYKESRNTETHLCRYKEIFVFKEKENVVSYLEQDLYTNILHYRTCLRNEILLESELKQDKKEIKISLETRFDWFSNLLQYTRKYPNEIRRYKSLKRRMEVLKDFKDNKLKYKHICEFPKEFTKGMLDNYIKYSFLDCIKTSHDPLDEDIHKHIKICHDDYYHGSEIQYFYKSNRIFIIKSLDNVYNIIIEPNTIHTETYEIKKDFSDFYLLEKGILPRIKSLFVLMSLNNIS